MATKLMIFRCMMCGHEVTEEIDTSEDKERACPRCRSNSIRHIKAKANKSQPQEPAR